ncbi:MULTISPECIES: histidine phosphatase family protein [Saccharibacillus]|uniref:histidine phosphatase family protein n=1 Tax=Saccharibacillus TaxID=456492 RepID=UPI00123A511C|nr:histidine phosphatase family protein [Saccharibacillus sp. WB 17]MWJ31433.1 histidine phosphatase family protein [Saccharibacillus sp. WB 17]
MPLLFVRHGQAEHNLDTPDRLERLHPKLTDLGRQQVAELNSRIRIDDSDLLLVSPTVRTLETLALLTEGGNARPAWVSPRVGPRMFPQNPAWTTLPCDIPLTREDVQAYGAGLKLRQPDTAALWRSGINAMPEAEFAPLARELIGWIAGQHCRRTIIVSHDGTINAYRQLLGEPDVSRHDFLGEAGCYTLDI